MKIINVMNKAFVRMYERYFKIKLKYDGKCIILKGKKRELTSQLKEKLRVDLYKKIKGSV